MSHNFNMKTLNIRINTVNSPNLRNKFTGHPNQINKFSVENKRYKSIQQVHKQCIQLIKTQKQQYLQKERK